MSGCGETQLVYGRKCIRARNPAVAWRREGVGLQLRRQAVSSCREQGRTQDFVPVYLRLERHLHGVAGLWSTADGAPGKAMAICALRALTLMKTGSWQTLAAGNALLSVLQFLSVSPPFFRARATAWHSQVH